MSSFANFLQANTITVSGNSEYPATLVRLIIFDDHISMHETTLAYAMSDDEGRFSLSANIEQIEHAKIAFGLDKAELILIPGGEYELYVPFQATDNFASYFEKEPLHFEILSANDNDLVLQIQEVNIVYNTFLLQYFNALYRGSRHDLIDSLRFELSRRVPPAANSFVNNYLDYRIAALEVASSNRTEQYIIDNYFMNKPVLYNNIEYMSLLKEIYSNHLTRIHSLSQIDLYKVLSRGYDSLDSLLTADENLMADHRLRELVMLLNINGMYASRLVESTLIDMLLKQVEARSPYPEHRKIASNIFKQHQILAFGTQAPLFRLQSAGHGSVDIRDMKDKYILINFIKKNCMVCENATLDLESLWQRFQDRFYFVTIATEDAFEDATRYFDDNQLRWPLLNLSQHILLLEQYQVSTFPEFVILLPKNRIGMAPAPGPDRHLEYHINRLFSLE